MKKTIKYLGLSCLMILGYSCTDLEIEPTDSLITEGFAGVADIQAEVDNVANIIAGGRLGNQEGLFGLNEVSSDEYIVPTRGTDWGDNGRWLSMHEHTWDAQLSDIVGAWQELNSVTINTTRIINEQSVNTTAGDVTELKAEARFYRAWAMHWILDMWRQVPYRDVNLPNSVVPSVLKGQVALDSIAADLEFAIQNLPTINASDDIALKNRPSKATANLLKAKVYLNKHVYLGETPQNTDMQMVVDAVNSIESNGYTLAASGDFFDIFRPSNDVETLWWSASDAGPRIWHTLHYNLNFPGDNDGGGWNGFTTLSEFYDLFEGDPNTNYVGDGQEERRGWVPDATTANADNLGIGYGFLIGQQYEQDGSPLNARDNVGNVPLVFEREVDQTTYSSPSDNAVLETAGIRMLKYHPNEIGGSRRSHIVKYRFADAYLMRAEAMMRMGADVSGMINNLRSIRGASPIVGAITEQVMLDERGREMYQEMVRRQDLIRFGKFLEPWNLKNAGSDHLRIFPVPISDVLANPNLVQNPGY